MLRIINLIILQKEEMHKEILYDTRFSKDLCFCSKLTLKSPINSYAAFTNHTIRNHYDFQNIVLNIFQTMEAKKLK